jgi:ABC-2 type transport system ATP-binding protein
VSAIVADRVRKRYGDLVAVRDLSFEVGRGEIVALLGPNGAGKTTTVEMLEGYSAPSAGALSVLGADPARGDRRWRERIGLVLQSTSLDGRVTVRDTLRAFARLFPRPLPVDEVLELIDLRDEANTRIDRLSGGQQRRVDLGVGIVGRPELLFLDEPTTGLDPAARRRIWAVVEASGATVFLTTHSMDETEHLADRLLVLVGGRLVADTTPSALRAAAASTLVRFPLPTTDGLPAVLAPHLANGELLARTRDPRGLLAALVDWARARDLDLTGLEVGPPSLETAYLELTGHA